MNSQNQQKILWDDLAKKNPKYYINSDFGKKISDDQFEESGKKVYQKLILDDGLIFTRESILDYGCGIGRLTKYMADDFIKVIGVDISPTMVKLAKEKLEKLTNIEIIETDGDSIPIKENSIEFVFSYLVFQHIKERQMFEKTFREIYRILKTGGIFKVLLRSDKQKDLSKWWSGIEYNKADIRKLCDQIGFKIIKIWDVDNNSYWLWIQK